MLNTTRRDSEDLKLLDRIAGGDESALSALYDQYVTFLHAIVVRMLRSTGEAEHILQEVFLRVWNKADVYRLANESVYTSLVTLTRNRALDRIRSKGHKRHIHPLDVERLPPLASANPGLNSPPEFHTADQRRSVYEALTRLTAEQRHLLTLAYYEGLSQSEIAELLAIPVDTVKSRMRAGLTMLREALLGRKGG